ncbi:MAG: integrin alpha, partial [Burkholderiaceae bacterium]|nr:integrin alpha [Burkholderiaceae bacterium]
AGWSVAGAGDINKDGYDDLIVGAPYGDDGGGNAGEAYVIFGSPKFGYGYTGGAVNTGGGSGLALSAIARDDDAELGADGSGLLDISLQDLLGASNAAGDQAGALDSGAADGLLQQSAGIQAVDDLIFLNNTYIAPAGDTVTLLLQQGLQALVVD